MVGSMTKSICVAGVPGNLEVQSMYVNCLNKKISKHVFYIQIIDKKCFDLIYHSTLSDVSLQCPNQNLQNNAKNNADLI